MKYLIVALLYSFSLWAHDAARIEAFLTLGDAQGALAELGPMLAQDPKNGTLQRLQILALAKSGNIPTLLKAYKELQDPLNKELLEEVAWAIIRKASKSSSPFIRQEAYVASFMTHDARGIPICQKALVDASEEMRLMALKLASNSRDQLLIDETLRLMQEDPSSNVRLAAIYTIGAMRLERAKTAFVAILESKFASMQEKIACVKALSHIEAKPDKARIEQLVKSERALLRQLACILVLEHLDKEHANLLLPLLNDPSFDVRLAAIQTLAAVGAKVPTEAIAPILAHNDAKTKMVATALCLVQGVHSDVAKEQLRGYLTSQEKSIRLMAASCLIHAGAAGVGLAKEYVKGHEDPLVRLNLAIALIWQRADLSNAKNAILEAMQRDMRLSWHEFGLYGYIGPNQSQHVGGYARLPESQDLLVRLELYSMLAACNQKSLKEPLTAFLKDKTWGISGQAAFLMMQEELLCFDELREFLDDHSEIALQAAFILAIFAQDEEALHVLQQAYPNASRQMKEYILFAVGNIGAQSALGFLVEVLNEPFESLRTAAARAILLSLYH